MHSRAAELGGRLEITSAPSRGTVVRVAVPAPTAAARVVVAGRVIGAPAPRALSSPSGGLRRRTPPPNPRELCNSLRGKPRCSVVAIASGSRPRLLAHKSRSACGASVGRHDAHRARRTYAGGARLPMREMARAAAVDPAPHRLVPARWMVALSRSPACVHCGVAGRGGLARRGSDGRRRLGARVGPVSGLGGRRQRRLGVAIRLRWRDLLGTHRRGGRLATPGCRRLSLRARGLRPGRGRRLGGVGCLGWLGGVGGCGRGGVGLGVWRLGGVGRLRWIGGVGGRGRGGVGLGVWRLGGVGCLRRSGRVGGCGRGGVGLGGWRLGGVGCLGWRGGVGGCGRGGVGLGGWRLGGVGCLGGVAGWGVWPGWAGRWRLAAGRGWLLGVAWPA